VLVKVFQFCEIDFGLDKLCYGIKFQLMKKEQTRHLRVEYILLTNLRPYTTTVHVGKHLNILNIKI
jgi:hypothetical protein